MNSVVSYLAEIVGSDGWIAAMLTALAFGVSWLVIEVVRDLKSGAHLVPHRKLRQTWAASAVEDVPTAQGSTAPSVEPTPAPIPPRGAGTNLQPVARRLDQGRRRDPSSAQPHPAPGTVVDPGPYPEAADAASATDPGNLDLPAGSVQDADTPGRTSVSASPQPPAAVPSPVRAAAGPQPRSSAGRDAGPSVAADGPVRGAA